MTRNHYENTIILKLEGGESQLKDIASRIDEIVSGMKGLIIDMESWGEKKLAYEIKKNLKGYYLHTNFSGPGKVVQELERNLRIMEPVLKFMTVRLETEEEDLEKLEKNASGIKNIVGEKEADHETVVESSEEEKTEETSEENKEETIENSKEYNKKLREALTTKKEEENVEDEDVEL